MPWLLFMGLERPAFTTTRTEEERVLDQTRTLSLKLNKQEQADLEEDMRYLDMGVDSACLKFLVNVGRKVIRDQIPAEQMKYLLSRDRLRYDGRKRR